MLIFGKSVADWEAKAAYAQDKGENEYAELHEIRCLGAETPEEAFALMAACAAHTNCEKFLYHATINLCPGERLTREQWRHSVDRLEEALKLTGHHRVVFEHIKNNRQHYHIVWSRVRPDGDGPTVVMSNNFATHERVAIKLEQEFGLKPAKRRPKDAPSKKRQAAETRNSKVREKPETVEADAMRIFVSSRTAKEFIKSFDRAGYVLTRGKNGSYVLVDRKGGYHGLLRRLKGVKLEDLRQKFPGLDKLPLPRLNEVLRSRHPANRPSFRKMAKRLAGRPKRVVSRLARKAPAGSAKRFRPTRTLAAMVAQAKARHPRPVRKNYPTAIKYKRRRKKDENQPSLRLPDRAEIERSDLLHWAWENGRHDILALFGIFFMPEHPTTQDLIAHGLMPPASPEP